MLCCNSVTYGDNYCVVMKYNRDVQILHIAHC